MDNRFIKDDEYLKYSSPFEYLHPFLNTADTFDYKCKQPEQETNNEDFSLAEAKYYEGLKRRNTNKKRKNIDIPSFDDNKFTISIIFIVIIAFVILWSHINSLNQKLDMAIMMNTK